MALFSMNGAHKAYGGGPRLRLSDEITLRFGLAKSVEELQAFVALGGDF